MIGESVGIVGAGAWGTALAIRFAGSGLRVTLWGHEAEVVERLRRRRDNPRYLPGVELPPSARVSGDLSEAAAGTGAVVLAVPTPFARAVYGDLAPHLPSGTPVLVAAKGIEEGTLALPAEVAREVLGPDRGVAVLSGPSFAEEVARGSPTAVVVASDDARLAEAVQSGLSDAVLRIYTNDDPTGVQVAGALKNVIAIAAGIVDGLSLGHNAMAALVTRGLAETRRLGIALGGKPGTFAGLAGLGDLVLTCTGSLSRNRRVGRALGRGERLEDVLGRSAHVAEGVRTARSARVLSRREGVEMPIVDAVCRLFDEETTPAETVQELMSRPLTSEEPDPREPIE